MSEVKATLIYHTPTYMNNIAEAMTKCYARQASHRAVIKHAVEAGHFSCLEHSSATIDIECSLAVLGQLTRHRHLGFTVKSSRGAEFDEYVTPANLQHYDIYHEAMNRCFHVFHVLVDNGFPLEDAAYVLPKGTITKLRVTGNLRAWFEYLPKRLCKRAMPEHRKLAQLIHKELAGAMPEIFDRAFMNCDNCKEHDCSFN